MKEYLPAVRAFPNARKLLDRLREDGLKLVVATLASDEELRGLLTALGDKSPLDDPTSSDDAARSKPDPDSIHAAVAKAELLAERHGRSRGAAAVARAQAIRAITRSLAA